MRPQCIGRRPRRVWTWCGCTPASRALYGAIGEQMDALDRLGIDWCPASASRFQAAAAGADGSGGADGHPSAFTPGTAHAGGRGPGGLAQSRATLCIFLPADRLAGGRPWRGRCGRTPGRRGLSRLLARPANRARHAGRRGPAPRRPGLTRRRFFLVGSALAQPLPCLETLRCLVPTTVIGRRPAHEEKGGLSDLCEAPAGRHQPKAGPGKWGLSLFPVGGESSHHENRFMTLSDAGAAGFAARHVEKLRFGDRNRCWSVKSSSTAERGRVHMWQ